MELYMRFVFHNYHVSEQERRSEVEQDFLDEMIEESTKNNPEFPALMEGARHKRKLFFLDYLFPKEYTIGVMTVCMVWNRPLAHLSSFTCYHKDAKEL